MIFRIHKEGHKITSITAIVLFTLTLIAYWLMPQSLMVVSIIAVILFLAVLQFFRNPIREIKVSDDNLLYAPADGKIVAIEEVHEGEYFNDKRLQVSIFMSVKNVHVNRNPISGTVDYFKYHPGKYLVAWHPKSSTENERTTTVINNGETAILLRQIAGAVAKRIVNYLEPGEQVTQGTDLGFIKFGSRVDLFLPIGTEVCVELGQKVKGNVSVIAKI